MSAVTTVETTERAQLLATLEEQRAALRSKLEGVSGPDAVRRTTVSELTLAGLLKHVAHGEESWTDFLVRGEKVDDMERYAASFTPTPEETVAVLLEQYAVAAARTDAAVRELPSLDATHPLPEAPWYPERELSARRVVAHLIAETARHTGHADIVREALDGQRG